MWLQFTRRTHYQIPFISYPKISSKARLMCTITKWQLLMVQIPPNIPFRADNHHTTLRVEDNQSRRRPTSSSLSKLPDSGLYFQLLSRGKTFPLASPETYGPIVGKSREKVEPLSLNLPLKYSFYFSLSWITLNRILKRRKLPPSFLHATCPLLDFFSLFLLYLGPSISLLFFI